MSDPYGAGWEGLVSTAANRSGSISLRTSEYGLPLGISIERAELRRDPAVLAQDIVKLCKQAANRAGLQRRAELKAAGVASDVLDRFGLPRQEDVTREEAIDDFDDEPQTWLRSI